ncbi:hypothetical protein QOZ89_25420 [Pseudofrankia sp. BMG5.37]|nr:hypothetical protein [Pseudofrankia sp. BMG5.37]
MSFVLAATLVATLTGAKCLRELGSRIADLSQPLLARLGAPHDHFRGIYRTPSEKTVRMLLKTIDRRVQYVPQCRRATCFVPQVAHLTLSSYRRSPWRPRARSVRAPAPAGAGHAARRPAVRFRCRTPRPCARL